MIKKTYLWILLLLAGCSAGPEYYSHSQSISLEGLSGYTDVFYEDHVLFAETKSQDSEKENISEQEYIISRSWNDQEFIIKKNGFKDYHLKLDSSFTSEPWAIAKYFSDEEHYFPLLGLLIPVDTIKEIVSIPTYLLLSGFSLITLSPIDFTEYMSKMGISLINLPKALVGDIYDIISVPGTIIINPWQEFKYDSVVILEPTEQLKQMCSTKKNHFISNHGCSNCFDSNIVLYASQTECNRCSNRQWEKGQCLLK